MNAKWYFSTLILALTFLGVFQKQAPVPNQEIVLEFVNINVTEADVQSAIDNVKQQLQTVGATNIEVQEAEDGTLKITYYSTVNVANIKQALSKDHQLVLDYTSNKKEGSNTPVTDKPSNYNLDVYEIKKGSETSSFGGKYIVEYKYDSDRFTNPNVYIPLVNTSIDKSDHIIKTAYKVNKQLTFTINNRSRKVPEVRAGPIC